MNIAVFGLGYVGSVTAACLAADGHRVTGVDLNEQKVDLINSGQGPVREPGLDALIAANVQAKRLEATTDTMSAVGTSDVGIVCVGTPSMEGGALDLHSVAMVMNQIGTALREREYGYTVVLRSTVLPGTTRSIVVPELERSSGKTHQLDFTVVFNPEFLREGSSLEDYANPPKVVIGTESGKPNEIVAEIYAEIDSPKITSSYEVAELAKYVDNSWHALKVTFANEVGRVARSMDVDSREVMSIMTGDTKLNISTNYLKPGFAYGGSCLPKDLAALTHRTKELAVDTPLLDAIDRSNDSHVESAVVAVESTGAKRVGVFGLSFKPDTDDVRNSPVIDLVNALITRGIETRVFDPMVSLQRMLGANRDYLLGRIPTVGNLMVSSAHELIQHGEVIVLTKMEPAFKEALTLIGDHQILFDFVGLAEPPQRGAYIGIGW